MNVLIVEDNKIQRLGICAILTEEYKFVNCFAAENYAQAMEELEKREYGMFLLDVELGVKNSEENGIALGIHIRTIPEYEDTPILYLTSFPSYAPEASHETGCYDYLVKPYGKEELVQAVNRFLSRHDTRLKPIDIRILDCVYRRVPSGSIIYIECISRTLLIHTTEGTIKVGRLQLGKIMAQLPDEFMRVNRCYVVNRIYLKSYDSDAAIVYVGEDMTPVPVSKPHRSEVRQIMNPKTTELVRN